MSQPEGNEMDDHDAAELAALPAILSYLLENRKPPHDNTDDIAWRGVFDDANYLAHRFSASYARAKRS